MAEPSHWWQRGIVYQIYPRSFLDTDGDGVGDLRGITRRLNYLTWLGVDAIWLSPIYPSPMADYGYDVADYCDVDSVFGTLADFDELVRQAHALDLKIILDWIPNHSSDQHPWFRASRSSRHDPQRGWYLWRDPKPDGGPPTNWLSVFGGGAWEFDAATDQSYFHAFLKEQPDLNWRNADVRQAMFATLSFWLDRGVDGFRIDVLPLLIKDDRFRDNPVNPHWSPAEGPYHRLLPLYTADRPEMRELVGAIRDVVDRYPDRVLLGEIGLPLRRLMAYYGVGGAGIHLPFNFGLIDTPWRARELAAFVDRYEGALPAGAWPNWVLGNHDRSRVVTRLGRAQGRVAAMLLLTLRGTPTIYYGDELGMRDVIIPAERARDPVERRLPGQGRDHQRAPMPWDGGPSAGFTAGDPWLPMTAEPGGNVAAERDDPDSMLALHRRLIALRREEPALTTGAYTAVPAEGDIVAYLRSTTARDVLVALNLGTGSAVLDPLHDAWGGRIVVGTHRDREGEDVGGRIHLRGDEGIVVELMRSSGSIDNVRLIY